MKRSPDKLFVIKKYVRALNAAQALRKERRQPADDCWVDEEWRKNNTDKLADAIGFSVHKKDI